MKDFFSIGETAKIVNMTSEALRHYDRIGLVHAKRREGSGKYRCYSREDIVRLNTIHALHQMDLSLQEIRDVLDYDDLRRVVDFLAEAEKKADRKIAELQYSKEKIRLARESYEKNLRAVQSRPSCYTQAFPARTILLSDMLEAPSLDVLWNYLSHFYDRIAPAERERFAFEDMAGIYTAGGRSRLFAVCIRHGETDGLKTLPAGDYLCADCTEENRAQKLEEAVRCARARTRTEPAFTVQRIVVSGILQWTYQIQVPLHE